MHVCNPSKPFNVQIYLNNYGTKITGPKGLVLSLITPHASPQELFILFPAKNATSCTLEKQREDCLIVLFI